MAAKRTSDLIPLCHPLPLSGVELDLVPRDDHVEITARVRTKGVTGVEMEALTAASAAALTVYDMIKAVDHLASIETDRKSTRLNSSHVAISYAVFCLKKKKKRT